MIVVNGVTLKYEKQHHKWGAKIYCTVYYKNYCKEFFFFANKTKCPYLADAKTEEEMHSKFYWAFEKRITEYKKEVNENNWWEQN
jgi:hypothetical protein